MSSTIATETTETTPQPATITTAATETIFFWVKNG